jgi:hypothetical protein
VRAKSKRERMSNFTITTNKQTAEAIENQSDWNKKMGHETSWVLGEISHYDGWSSVQIKAKDGHKIKPEELFF